jgi:carboxymethylenebutenolidase
MNEAQKVQGRAGRFETMVRLLRTDHLNDQMAALAWLKESGFVHPRRIAVAGNSFGGIQTLLGAESGSYCAAIASAAAAQTWSAPVVQSLMTKAVGNAQAPIFFFQAENDWDLTPSRSLAATAESAGKRYRVKIYPPFGSTKEEGHSFTSARRSGPMTFYSS